MNMSQLDRLGRNVSQKIRIRGRQYFELNAVRIVFRILILCPPKFPALKIYEVDLEREGNAVIFSCDCPYFEDHREVCKHVWATLLQLEKLGHLQEWNSLSPKKLIATDSDDDLDDDYIDDFDLGGIRVSSMIPDWLEQPEPPRSTARPHSPIPGNFS